MTTNELIRAYADARYKKGVAVGKAVAAGLMTDWDAQITASITFSKLPPEVEELHLECCRLSGELKDLGLLT